MIIKHGLVMDPVSGLSEHMDILVKTEKLSKLHLKLQTIQRKFWKQKVSLSALAFLIHMYISATRDSLIKKIFIPELLLLPKADLQLSSVWQILPRLLIMWTH